MKREVGDYIEDIIGAMDKAMNFVKTYLMKNLSRTIKLPLL